MAQREFLRSVSWDGAYWAPGAVHDKSHQWAPIPSFVRPPNDYGWFRWHPARRQYHAPCRSFG